MLRENLVRAATIPSKDLARRLSKDKDAPNLSRDMDLFAILQARVNEAVSPDRRPSPAAVVKEDKSIHGYVLLLRAAVKATDEPLPRIPPFRLRGGLRYQHNAFQAGGEVVRAAKQDRLAVGEEPTDGYTRLKLFTSYSFGTGGGVSTITARLDNATNELYRNHLSLIKQLVPEMGRNFKLLYNVTF